MPNMLLITTDIKGMKLQLKERAIALRQEGLSYREIMQTVPVAKSTIGLWLRSVGLSQQQKQRLTEKKLAAIQKGADAKKQQRIETTEEIMTEAIREVTSVSRRELWLIGIMLYWAEGSKEKEYRPSGQVRFTNTDPDMICLFLRWLKKVCGKTMDDLIFSIYIHDLQRQRTSEIVEFWSKTIGCSNDRLRRVYYKKGNPKTKRKNVGATYHGTLVIKVRSSTTLIRRIAGWTQGVVKCLR